MFLLENLAYVMFPSTVAQSKCLKTSAVTESQNG